MMYLTLLQVEEVGKDKLNWLTCMCFGQVVEHTCLPKVRHDVSLFVVGGTFCKRLEKIR